METTLYRNRYNHDRTVEAGRPEPTPAVFPDPMPELKTRAMHAVKFLIDLLEVARPAVFTAWAPAAFAGVAISPSGLMLKCADGSIAYLRVTSGFGGRSELDVDDFPDYRIATTIGM